MKKVRIDWNNVQEPWSPIRFLSAGTLNPDLLKAIDEQVYFARRPPDEDEE